MQGEATVAGRRVCIRIELLRSFPSTLPRIFIQPWDALGFIPHIEPSGLVCYADRNDLVVIRDRPVDVVLWALDEAIKVLVDGVTRQNVADFTDEFGVYWSNLADAVLAQSFLDPRKDVCEVTLLFAKGAPITVASAAEEASRYDTERHAANNSTHRRAIYIPLIPGSIVIPPRPDWPMWTAELARINLRRHLSETNSTHLQKLLHRKPNRQEYVVLYLQGLEGRGTLFGILYTDVGSVHPLLDKGTAEHLTPIHFERLDRSFLVRRSGGEVDLGTKHVLLVGCGAIGGHLAMELARAGVGHLTLVDPQLLLPENTHRHALGRRFWNTRKAKALKEAIEAEIPYIHVDAIVGIIEEALENKQIDLANYDLMVSAIGDPTMELALNERLFGPAGAPMIVFTWLEPLGIGGHALLTIPGNPGCFSCLYSAPDGQPAPINRAAFVAPDQVFSRTLTGCRGRYTPYGSADAVQTAVLASRVSVGALLGRHAESQLCSWRGDADGFRAAGYRVSNRYEMSETQLGLQRHEFRNPHCRVCGCP